MLEWQLGRRLQKPSWPPGVTYSFVGQRSHDRRRVEGRRVISSDTHPNLFILHLPPLHPCRTLFHQTLSFHSQTTPADPALRCQDEKSIAQAGAGPPPPQCQRRRQQQQLGQQCPQQSQHRRVRETAPVARHGSPLQLKVSLCLAAQLDLVWPA